jgi:magnesium transporter
VLTADKLVTLRYGEPKPFKIFAANAQRQPHLCATAVDTFLNLLDAIVDRTADVLERIDDQVDATSLAIFKQPNDGGYEACLYRLGVAQTTNAEIRRSMASLSRATSFATLAPSIEKNREALVHLRTITRDADSLNQQSDALAANVGFLLNAALGFINLQQVKTSRIFTIMSVLFLPPTLVASTYGMNFEFMPELGWRYGYLWALGLMVTSVVTALVVFKRKRWL